MLQLSPRLVLPMTLLLLLLSLLIIIIIIIVIRSIGNQKT